ncbi:MAG: mechanosensitive ion channel domain-containing protein [Pseudomonadota bacterium]
MRLLLFLCLPLFLAITPMQAQEADGTISAVSTPADDAAMATRFREILSELGNYDDVQVSVSEGVVTFEGTATSALEVAELDNLAVRVEGVVAVKNEVTETTDIARRLNPAIERFQDRVSLLVTILPVLAIALAVALLIIWIGFLLARARRPWDRLAPNAFIADLYRTIVRLVFILAALVIALDILNATALLSTILGAAGIIGLALGFAVRDTVENFIASIMLSIRQPFRPNDTVEINGDQGKVIRLTSRATILLSFDGNHIRIPNATVFKSRIINYSQNIERRFMFSLLIDRNADLGQARELVTQTVQDLPFVLDEPAVAVWIDTFETTGVSLVITGWIDQHATSLVLAKGEAIRHVKQALLDANIGMTDSSQVVVLDRKAQASAPAPQPENVVAVAEVATPEEDHLERIINAERADEVYEDLLGEDSLPE